MEWVSTTAKSVPEAIDQALDTLGVDQTEAEIVVVEEPKQGLFGRVRGAARVKARVRPLESSGNDTGRGRRKDKRRSGSSNNKRSEGSGNRDQGNRNARNSKPSAKDDSQASDRPKGREKSASGSQGRNRRNNAGGRSSRNRTERDMPESSLEDVSAHLAGFLSGLSTAFGLDGEVRVDEVEENGVVATIEGRHGLLVGPKGRTIDAIQELSRMSAQRSVPSSVRISVDVGGYRERRNEALESFAIKAADKAATENVEVSLEPMNSSDRKVIHNTLTEVPGIETRSVGDEPRRRVVVVPVDTADDLDESE